MSCFNSRCIKRQIRGKVFWLASGKVLVYEYQGFQNNNDDVLALPSTPTVRHNCIDLNLGPYYF